MSCQVYLITETDDNCYCKVGLAQNAEQRLRSLQTGNPRTLCFIGAWQLPSLKAAQEVERLVLSRFRNGSAMGEWFQPPDGLSVSNPNTIASAVERIIEAAGYEVVDA